MVSFWCIFKEFLKRIACGLAILGAWFGVMFVIGTVITIIGTYLPPIICKMSGFLFIVGGIIFIILMALYITWRNAKEACILRETKGDEA